MSSIYKKGRDGYYYYQAYVTNPLSGKKDKRIFHSLKTKEHSVALEKQKILDKKYKKVKKNKHFLDFIVLKKLKYPGLVLLLLFLLFKSNAVHKNSYTDFKSDTESNEQILEEKMDDFKIKIGKNNKNPIYNFKEEKINHLIGNNEIRKSDRKVLVPDYKIIREDRLSDVFKLGKFFIVVSDPYDSESLKNICETILKKNSDLKNIVVCIYKDNQLGIDIASGKNTFINKEEEKDVWLAMYTFNEIEGAFFNDNPSGFIERF